MGIFYEQEEVVNRTSEQLMVIYDGQRIYLPANYTAEGKRIKDVVNMLPSVVIPYALNQTAQMGTEQFNDPSSFVSKVGFPKVRGKKPKSWNDCSYLPPTDELTRVSREQILEELADPKVTGFVVRGNRIHNVNDSRMNKSTTPFDIQATH